MIDERLVRRAIKLMSEATTLLQAAIGEDETLSAAQLKFLATPISQLDIGRLSTTRLHNLACSYQTYVDGDYHHTPLVTVRDLVRLSEAEILRTPNTGLKTLKALKEVLGKHGLHCGMSV